LSGKPIVFRTPIVHGVNDSEEEIGQIAQLLSELKELRRVNGIAANGAASITYELLAFHRLASDKYLSLGREYAAAAFNPPTDEKMKRLAAVAQRHGIETLYR
jgi:pyruvate formate lyase activating enzyme